MEAGGGRREGDSRAPADSGWRLYNQALRKLHSKLVAGVTVKGRRGPSAPVEVIDPADFRDWSLLTLMQSAREPARLFGTTCESVRAHRSKRCGINTVRNLGSHRRSPTQAPGLGTFDLRE